MKQSIGRFLLKIFSITLFLLVVVGAVFFAYGYRFDTDNGLVQKTSIIDVAAPKTAAKVYLDGIEQAQSLPVQLKSVLPGDHDLIVQKDGFISWSRSIKVKEDVVSIVRDVLLVPRDLQEYKTEEFVLEEENIIPGNGYILAYNPASNVVKALVFRDLGLVSNDEISLYRNDFEVIDSYSDDTLLLQFLNGVYASLSLESGSFRLFTLPHGYTDVFIDVDSSVIFYLLDDTLYFDLFDMMGLELKNEPYSFGPDRSVVLSEHVDDFVVSRKAQSIFFVSMGMLYSMDLETDGKVRLLDQVPGTIEDLLLVEGNNHDALLLQKKDDESGLYWISDTGETLHHIAYDVVDQSFIDGRGRILYYDSEGKLFSYYIEKEESRFIRQFDADFELLGWFDDVGHYLYSQEETIYVADIYSGPELPLLEGDSFSFVYAQDGALFWLDDKRLMRLYWNEAF